MEEKKFRTLLCAEYFLTKDTIPEEVAQTVQVGDFLITNIGIEKVISVTDGNIVTEDSDIDYATARIIDVRNLGAKAQVFPRNPLEVEDCDYKKPVEKYDGETISKKSLNEE